MSLELGIGLGLIVFMMMKWSEKRRTAAILAAAAALAAARGAPPPGAPPIPPVALPAATITFFDRLKGHVWSLLPWGMLVAGGVGFVLFALDPNWKGYIDLKTWWAKSTWFEWTSMVFALIAFGVGLKRIYDDGAVLAAKYWAYAVIVLVIGGGVLYQTVGKYYFQTRKTFLEQGTRERIDSIIGHPRANLEADWDGQNILAFVMIATAIAVLIWVAMPDKKQVATIATPDKKGH